MSERPTTSYDTWKNGADNWRWRNVPIPEAHVTGLVVGGVLHALVPKQVSVNLQRLRIAGWTMVGVGTLAGAWAVLAAGSRDIDHPSELVTTGPFAFSRNPMYVAWTALYVGIALIVRTAWLWMLLPVVMAATHLTVREEERSLEDAFGDDYRDYKTDVRRYL